MYAQVIIELGAKKIDKKFTYIIPSNLEEEVQVGVRVIVPFGRMTLEGFVIKLMDKIESNIDLKSIIKVVDIEPILNEEMLWLGREIKDKTLCSLISAYQVMLPKALKASIKTKTNIKVEKLITLIKPKEETLNYLNKCPYKKQKEILNTLLQTKEIKIDKVDSSIKTLVKHELIAIKEKEVYRYNRKQTNYYHEVILNASQQQVVNIVTSNLNKQITYLLYGVTGSGKTEVYMEIISQVITRDKSAIMLVPEIGLTPQMMDRFMTKFQDKVAILHSGLSDNERYDEYRKIKRGEVKIVIGTRSAIFAPLGDLGIIIIDEEHTVSYKQDNHPRYNAKDVANLRSSYHQCPVILGSATPSLESFAKAGNKVYQLLVLNKRANQLPLPEVKIVDMGQEVKNHHFIFSQLLQEEIKTKLNKHEQIILLLNRRGYSSMITCSQCGYVAKCPNCDITLTYHKTSDTLKCHYCGYAEKRKHICPVCHSKDEKDFGLGTQRLEEELKKLFKARVVRMDLDTTGRKGAHEKIVEAFRNHEYDILVGTQMIAKGLDFPLVTLVGVINADTTLNIPDFRSSERTFQLLCQVAGRAGRSENPGSVIIQTFNPTHYSIMYAKNHDYLGFYKQEMQIRKKLNYSPYYYIILVKIECREYELGFKHANKIGEFLRNNVSKDTIILGPTMSNIFKINNVYHYQCLIKYRHDPQLTDTLIKMDHIYKSELKVNVEIDVDPIRL